jgi:hypothetical protein
LVNSTTGKPIETDWRRLLARMAITFGEGQIGLLALTQDARASQAAFKEKRKPQWTGK